MSCCAQYSSTKKPEANREVTKSSPFTALSDLSAEAFFMSSDMMECMYFTSMVVLETK